MTQDDAIKPTTETMSEADEEAIRAKLREAGWDKNKILSKSKNGSSASTPTATTATASATATTATDASATRRESDDKSEKKRGKDKDKERETRDARDRERGRDRDRDRDSRSGRTEKRRSRSARPRRDGGRDRERHRDRERERGSCRRRSSRSPSMSKSRSRSASARGSSRRDKDRSGRDRSRADKRRSRSVSGSRSPSKTRGGASKRSRRGDAKTEGSPTARDTKKTNKADDHDDENKAAANGENGTTAMEVVDPAAKPKADSSIANGTDGADKKNPAEATKESKKDLDDRKSRKSSRHRSRSTSRSPSRSRRRRRRHRSPSRSRSASRHRRGRGSSRSRSRSHARRHRSSRRRSSRSRSRSRHRSRSYSRRRRSTSRDRSRRDANSSPQPHQFPPGDVASAAANPLNPSIAQLMQQYPTMSLQDIIAKMQASNVTMAAAVSMKPARELYVGNLPTSVTGPQLQEFLGTIIQQVGLTVQPGNPILSTWISTDGHFAFCEMRSIDECNMALMLNQLPLLGQPLKFGRPKSFMGPPQPMPVLPSRTQTALSNLGCTPNMAWFATPTLDASSVTAMTASLSMAPSLASMTMPVAPFAATIAAPSIPFSDGTSSNKLIMSNIPVVLTAEQVKELVEPFGELKSFELLYDPVTQQSTGSALFEYLNENVTDDAKNGLDGLDLGGIPLAVRRASTNEETGPVLRMANMVSIDELKDDEEFGDLKEDVEDECKRFGKVVTLEIPRPKDGGAVAGLGDIFVQFETSNEAAAALKALSGRKFGGNIVKVSYFPLAKLQQKDFV